ncbi:MAG: aminotransferase class I/II-fold pyridoxal phosphate-dependent enzyme [bacterium]
MFENSSSDIDLAVFTGKPAFNSPLHVGRPNIGNRESFLTRVNEMLDRNWLSNNGPFVQQFEAKLADYLQVKHCIVTCNATIALEIVIRAAGLTGEVLVPSFTFIATAHSLKWQEINPVFCDIDPNTHCLDTNKIESLITPKTTGILGVHTWGRPCAIEQLTEIAKRHNLKLLFDAAHAFGCVHNGRMIGGFGLAEVFSFHATKFFNTFEGGAITTNDDELAAKLRLMKNFGFAGYDNVIYIGTNGKMTEVSAAMGLSNLESLDNFIEINKYNFHLYQQHLLNISGVKIIQFDNHDELNYQYVVLEIDENEAGLSRDEIVQCLHAENILARRYFFPGCHNMEPYHTIQPDSHLQLPETERLCRRVLLLPTGTAVNSNDIQNIGRIIRLAISHSTRVHAILNKENDDC